MTDALKAGAARSPKKRAQSPGTAKASPDGQHALPLPGQQGRGENTPSGLKQPPLRCGMMCDSAQSRIATRGLSSPRKDAGRGAGYPQSDGPISPPGVRDSELQTAGMPTPPQQGVQRKRVPEYGYTSQS